MERLEEALGHVGRRSASLALMFIDLDRFKLVNDRADHSAGDLVLKEMANRMTAMTRGVDLVARFGGDEFVAFAEVDHEEDAYEMAERIRRGLSEPIDFGDAELEVTSSIGVVVTSDESTAVDAASFSDADNAMYDAKRAGRDQVVMYRANLAGPGEPQMGHRPGGCGAAQRGLSSANRVDRVRGCPEGRFRARNPIRAPLPSSTTMSSDESADFHEHTVGLFDEDLVADVVQTDDRYISQV